MESLKKWKWDICIPDYTYIIKEDSINKIGSVSRYFFNKNSFRHGDMITVGDGESYLVLEDSIPLFRDGGMMFNYLLDKPIKNFQPGMQVRLTATFDLDLFPFYKMINNPSLLERVECGSHVIKSKWLIVNWWREAFGIEKTETDYKYTWKI